MNKNILIAVLIGIIVGQFSSSYAHADSSLGITRHDLLEACVLGGIFANSTGFYPTGKVGGPTRFEGRHICETVKQYADALDQKQ